MFEKFFCNDFFFIFFFLISILIFVFAFGSGSIDGDKLYKPIVWVLLIFSLMLISENFTNNDYADGSLKGITISWLFRKTIILSKRHCNVVDDYVANIFLIPISSILFNVTFTNSVILFLNICLACPSLILISLVSALFSIQLKNNKIIQFIIIFPFYIPIIIFTTSTTKNDIDGYIFDDNNFLILIGIFFITLPICLLISKLIMKEINR